MVKKYKIEVTILAVLIALVLLAAGILIFSDHLFKDSPLISAAMSPENSDKQTNNSTLGTVLQTINDLDQTSRSEHSAMAKNTESQKLPSLSLPTSKGTEEPTEPSATQSESESADPTTLPSTELPTDPPEPVDPDSLDYKYIALTFDDGPYDIVDEGILNLLNTYEGKATFFIVGSRIQAFPETIVDIVEQGSEIGIHAYNHPDLATLTPEEIQSEMTSAATEINAVIDYQPSIMRPPYGSQNDYVRDQINMPLILWSVDSRDWSSKEANAIAAEITDVPAGSIVLMHSLYPATLEALEMTLPDMYAQGYRFVTVTELFKIYNIPLYPHVAYGQAY